MLIMKRVNFLSDFVSSYLYSYGKMKLNCMKKCKIETKLN